jgi:hypothetical protein
MGHDKKRLVEKTRDSPVKASVKVASLLGTFKHVTGLDLIRPNSSAMEVTRPQQRLGEHVPSVGKQRQAAGKVRSETEGEVRVDSQDGQERVFSCQGINGTR